MFDVGQRVETPMGEAIVVHVSADLVRTDQGTFRIGDIAAYLDVDAITASIETLEEWLDDLSEPVEAALVVGKSSPCSCKCGRAGHCHHLIHVDKAGAEIKRYPHSVITGECRCWEKGCACSHS